MMEKWRILSVWCFIACIDHVATADFSCLSKQPSPNPNDPMLPSIPGDSYQAHVEVNILDKNYTMDVDEYLDYEGNRGLMKITRNKGEISTRIYSYDTDEVFNIKGQTCTVGNLTTDRMSFIYGYEKGNGDIRHIFGSAASLRYASGSPKAYGGFTTVRGIHAEKWSDCLTWPGTVGPVQITYYFNAIEWNPATAQVQLPLRIEVKGTSARNGNHDFHHIYDFINFVPTLLADPTIFETPTDVVCVGRLKVKSVPSLSTRFHYKAEFIQPAVKLVINYEVWYDDKAQLVREDKIYDGANALLYSKRPVTEINDFKSGVRYIQDRILGNCSQMPIDLDDNASEKETDTNQLYTIGMKDAYAFFNINENSTYTGQRIVRGILCDVYSMEFDDYKFGQMRLNASFHYFFMAEDWTDEFGTSSTTKASPVRLEIRSSEFHVMYAYNFYDFEDRIMDRNAFDVSNCFDNSNKLTIRITFPGKYVSSTEESWKNILYYGLANAMALPPIRISKLSLQSDSKNVYVQATLLGTSYADQFRLTSHTKLEHAGNKLYTGISSSQQCAALCINNPDFLCNAYDFCPDDSNACHLSNSTDKPTKIMPKATICDHYSRISPDKGLKEPTLEKAYSALRSSIANGTFFITIQNPDGFTSVFSSIEVEIISGYLSSTKSLPSLPKQFSYRLERILPHKKTVSDLYVWYDSVLNLVRMDSRDMNQFPSYETSKIHDFTAGISYTINKVTGKCSVSAIPNKGVFDVNSAASKANKDAGLVVKMKSPLELLYLDNSYQYIGQESVRGILCDVFQSRRTDFHIKYFDRTIENSIFTFYFQADDWKYYTADSLDTTISQPIKLEIEDTEVNEVIVMNFFDFNDEHHSLDYYDASACFGSDEKKTFVITFKNQSYHPTLDLTSPSFITAALLKLSASTGTSMVRFQEASVRYDDVNVYLMVTALGSLPPSALFTPIQKVTLKQNGPTLHVDNADDCALACLQISSFRCQSFDFCPNQKPTVCRPNNPRAIDPKLEQVNATGKCMHYSITEPGSTLTQDVSYLYMSISRDINNGLLKIPITPPGGLTKVYIATDIRDDIFSPTGSQSAILLQSFHEIKNVQINESSVIETHKLMTLEECTQRCLREATFHCQAFGFNFNAGTCQLASQHADEMTISPTESTGSNIYSLLYTNNYHKTAGSVSLSQSDKVATDTFTTELCARACDEESDFRCESFNFCTETKTCSLLKSNTLSPHTSATVVAAPSACSHYSRKYLFDFDKHPHKVIDGHDDVVVTVDDVTQCAVLCATGELAGCASFEICPKQRGQIQCVLSSANPAVNSSLLVTNSQQCSLYTVGNAKSAMGTAKCPRRVTHNPLQTGTTARNRNTNARNRNTNARTRNTTYANRRNTRATGQDKKITDPGSSEKCPSNQKQSAGSSDTGVKIGIGFGASFAGILIGSLAMFMYFKYRSERSQASDTHPLRSLPKL